MIIRDSTGQITPFWHDGVSKMGPYHRMRPTFAGRAGRPAHYPFPAEMDAFTGKPFQLTGMIWTLGAVPHPAFVGRFGDGTLVAFALCDVFEGWSTLSDAIARSRAYRTAGANVVPFPPAAGQSGQKTS